MRKIYSVLFLLFLIFPFCSSAIADEKLSICGESIIVKFEAVQNSDFSKKEEQKQCLMEMSKYSRNFNAVISKTDGVKVLEHIKTQSMSSEELSEKEKINSLNTIHQNSEKFNNSSRQKEIHQNSIQRK